MNFRCKGICTKPVYAHKKVVRDIKNTTYKKCSSCCLCISYEGIFCPCCRCRLSTRQKPRKTRSKLTA
uniref:ORF12 n=1 Tax=Nitrosopumilaceae spindle-shaped virus TaxID=3065433 RepID=A0AAT9JA25_9VIRU